MSPEILSNTLKIYTIGKMIKMIKKMIGDKMIKMKFINTTIILLSSSS